MSVSIAPKQEESEEIVNIVCKEILPILKSQPGFLEISPFEPENKTEKLLTVTLWARRGEAKRRALRAGGVSQGKEIRKLYLRHRSSKH